MSEYWQVASELSAAGEPFVVVTLVSTRGYAPQDPGAKAIVTREGLRWGTVGGGKVEARCIVDAREWLSGSGAPRDPRLLTWNLQRDIGMTCGGEATYLFELHDAVAWPIVVFGAGHVAQALVRTLLNLDCRVTCIDARPEWIERLPSSPKLKAYSVPQPADEIAKLDPSSFFVVMTQGHAHDIPIFEALFKRIPKPRYVGGIGSDVKAIKSRKELRERGISDESIAQLRCPIGLPLGGNHPYEIAISIAGELIQARDKK